MSNNFTGLPFETPYNEFTQKEVVDALYHQWKRDQQLEKTKVMAANIDLFFGAKPSSETYITSAASKRKDSNGRLTGLIKRGRDKLLGTSKSAMPLDN